MLMRIMEDWIFTLDLFTTDTYSMAIQTPTTAPVELCFDLLFVFLRNIPAQIHV